MQFLEISIQNKLIFLPEILPDASIQCSDVSQPDSPFFTIVEVLPQEVQKPDQRCGVQGAVSHLRHPRPRGGFREKRAG